MRILYFQTTRPSGSLGEACLALTPKVSLYSHPTGLSEIFLDIAGTQQVFGGEARLLFHAESLARSFGWEGRLVLTDRPEWARPLASARRRQVLLPPGKSLPAILQLPLPALADCGDPAQLETERRERDNLIGFLQKIGMRTIGDFTRLDVASIGLRFGQMGVALHDWATGRKELRLPIFSPEETIGETIDAEDIDGLERLLFRLGESAPRLEARLRGRGLGAKRVQLRFRLESRETLVRDLHLSEPLQESRALLTLLRDFLQRTTWSSPLLSLQLDVVETVPWLPGQLHLFDESEKRFADLAQYVGRLRARYGQEAIGIAELRESYLPERSWQLVWPPVPASVPLPPRENRPLFVFVPPRPCSAPQGWNLAPTENLTAEWWEPGGNRRYFIAENGQGERFWLYQDRETDSWFLHGTFD